MGFCAAAAAAPFSLLAAFFTLPYHLPLIVVPVSVLLAFAIGLAMPVPLREAALLIDRQLGTKERAISALSVAEREDDVACFVRRQAEEVARAVTPPFLLPRWAVLSVWLHLVAALIFLTTNKGEPISPFLEGVLVAASGAPTSFKKRLQKELRGDDGGRRRRVLRLAGGAEAEVKRLREVLAHPKIAALLAKIASGAGAGGKSGRGAGAAEALRRAAEVLRINTDLAALLRSLAEAVKRNDPAAVRRLLDEIEHQMAAISRTAQKVTDAATAIGSPQPGEGESSPPGPEEAESAHQLAPQTRLALIRAERYPPFLRRAVERYFGTRKNGTAK